MQDRAAVDLPHGEAVMARVSASNFNEVIAALRLLAAKPGGATNGPAFPQPEAPCAVHPGRLEGGIPLPPSSRPSWEAFRRLERENQLLVDHVEKLACALGACPNCWGTIADCEDCAGTGAPGAFNPDRACFDQFVLPVMGRVIGAMADSPDGISIPNDPGI